MYVSCMSRRLLIKCLRTQHCAFSWLLAAPPATGSSLTALYDPSSLNRVRSLSTSDDVGSRVKSLVTAARRGNKKATFELRDSLLALNPRYADRFLMHPAHNLDYYHAALCLLYGSSCMQRIPVILECCINGKPSLQCECTIKTLCML